MAEEKEKRVQEEDRRQAQIERDLGGAPSTAAPDRSRQAAMKRFDPFLIALCQTT